MLEILLFGLGYSLGLLLALGFLGFLLAVLWDFVISIGVDILHILLALWHSGLVLSRLYSVL